MGSGATTQKIYGLHFQSIFAKDAFQNIAAQLNANLNTDFRIHIYIDNKLQLFLVLIAVYRTSAFNYFYIFLGYILNIRKDKKIIFTHIHMFFKLSQRVLYMYLNHLILMPSNLILLIISSISFDVSQQLTQFRNVYRAQSEIDNIRSAFLEISVGNSLAE